MTEKLRAIIVDDESLARKGLQLRLDAVDQVEVVGECGNGREARQAVAELRPDVLFLDIQMPGESGFDVVAKLQADDMPLVIFTTAYDQYAIEAFKLHAIDYLLKPIEPERLQDAVDRAVNRKTQEGAISDKQRLLELIISITGKSEPSIEQLMKEHNGVKAYPEKIAIRDGAETTLVAAADIDWVDAAGDYMCVHANDATHVMRITMKELECMLDPATFQRVHRSTIVNLDRVTRVCSHMNGEFHLILDNGSSIKMSRSYKDKVRHFF